MAYVTCLLKLAIWCVVGAVGLAVFALVGLWLTSR